jgi:holo-[acyl-carrier protein] synthase
MILALYLHIFNKMNEYMIIGIGNDIVSVKDIEQSIGDSKRFLERTFCPSEQEYAENKPNKYQHYAGCFAAKEAVMKALGTGWNEGIQWKQIEVKHETSGKPRIELHDQAKKQAELLQVKTIYVSLSHIEQYATAVVILEK